MIWNIKTIEAEGFTLITDHDKWCVFRGHGFEVYINLKQNKGYFNFKAYKNTFKGNFKIILNTVEELRFILNRIQ